MKEFLLIIFLFLISILLIAEQNKMISHEEYLYRECKVLQYQIDILTEEVKNNEQTHPTITQTHEEEKGLFLK